MKKEKTLQNYYIGLDIGTNSVGYAVTDEHYKLLKFKGEPMWGAHTFEEAQSKLKRRSFRSARRRLDRRQQRVQLVAELFCKEIVDIDEKFFIRLQQSSLKASSVEDKFRLFESMEEHIAFNKKYPTIHHLIKDLMTDDEKHDIRHIYIACAWLVAHRGHFLSEINKDNIDEINDFKAIYQDFVLFMANSGDTLSWGKYENTMEKVLRSNLKITAKHKQLLQDIFENGKSPKGISTEHPYNIDALLKLLAGGAVDFKALFDWSLLINILKGKSSISEAKIEIYEQHKNDLIKLKDLICKYAKDKYNCLFRGEESTYGKYISSKINQEDFYKEIKNILQTLNIEEDNNLKEEILAKIDLLQFMPKQVDTNNRVIPYQLYWHEMKQILLKAEKHHSFLQEKDESGLSVSDKLLSIMEYRIPYFVGPLNSTSEFSWIERKEEGKILPWNYKEKIDLNESEQAFIKRMTNTCSYVMGAKVLPKNSLCYTSFEVLNTINNLKINNQPISVECKQDIYRNLFMERAKVSVSKLQEFLLSNNYMTRDATISGIDSTVTTLKCSLKAYHGFRRLLTTNVLKESDVEEIIEQMSYSEDKHRLNKWIKERYAQLNEDDIKYIVGLKFKEFGRLSKELLVETLGVDTYSGSGEKMSIMEALWNTNCNLQEILSSRFTFSSSIEEKNADKPLSLEEIQKNLWVNNIVKRSITRTLDVLKDIQKVMGHAPKRIFVEMPRGEEPNKKGNRTKSRYEQIKELYKKVSGEDVRRLNAQLDEMGSNADTLLQSDALFLYYIQLGRCMYTGKEILISQLKDGTYNIDHIYPQCLVKDDSVINNKCLVYSWENGRKKDTYPVDASIQHSMSFHWKRLKDAKLISEEKYNRLTRTTPFTDSEKQGFIARQLVVTSQATKAIATVLQEKYPKPHTSIVYVKAKLVSDFRKEVLDMVKSRKANDLHHAKDAYLNIVVGNVYDARFTHNFRIEQGYSLKTETIFKQNAHRGNELVWDKERSLSQVSNTMQKNNIHFTVYQFEKKGELFKQKPVSGKDKSSELVPLKKGKDTVVYGGYQKPSISFFILARYSLGKKKELSLIPIQLLHSKKFKEDECFREEYVKNYLGTKATNIEILFNARTLKVNTVFSLDGLLMSMVGKSNNTMIMNLITQPILGIENEKYIKKIEVLLEKINKNKNHVFDEKYDGINKEKNLALYDTYIEKLSSYPFNKRMNNPWQLLQQKRDEFIRLEVIKQAKCLEQIQCLFKKDGLSNLSYIGGVQKAGKTLLSLNISMWKKSYKDVRLVDTSASGLFETISSINLLDLI